MTLSAINPAAHAASLPEVQTATPAPVASKSSPAPTDTVTLSSAAQKASQGGDIDHDGDSH
jgi:hypothetical protein